jgi:predicted RNA-binding Zn-ribbon protein involved in translation (DUF1610 family)
MPMTVQKCIVCNNPQAMREPGPNIVQFECPRCGTFVLSGSAEATLEPFLTKVPLRRSLMSHTLRRMQRPDQKHLHKITTDELPSYWRDERLPTPLEQADNLILWIGDNQEAPQAWADTTQNAIAATVGIAVSPDGNDSGGWLWLNSQLEKKGLYKLHSTPRGGMVRATLEMGGWQPGPRAPLSQTKCAKNSGHVLKFKGGL